MVMDTLHHVTGIPRPRWDFSRFDEKVAAYDMLGEVHYRYYQYHSGMVVSLVFDYFCRRLALGIWFAPLEWLDLAFFVLGGILFAGSRDNFRKYNQRLTMVLGEMSVADGAPRADSSIGTAKDSSQLEDTNPDQDPRRC